MVSIGLMCELFVKTDGINWSDRECWWKVVRFIQDTLLAVPPESIGLSVEAGGIEWSIRYECYNKR